jgi:hypothetical protein
MTGAEAAEQTANRAEKAAARPLTPEQNDSEDDNPRTPLPIRESQGGTTITLALRTSERLHRSHNLVPSVACEALDSSESQAQPPASTAPARIEEGEELRKRRRMQNKLYRESQYEL